MLEKQKDHALASVVVAKLDAKAGRNDEAIKALESALKKDDPNSDILLALGRMYAEGGKTEKAIEMFELGRQHDPYDKDWLQELSRVYAQSGDRTKQISVLKDLVPLDADDLDRRLRLARLLLEAKKPADAEKYAREALEIDVTSKEAREGLFKALKAQDKGDELARVRKLLEG